MNILLKNDKMEKEGLNEQFRNRTKSLAVRIIRRYAKLPKTDEARIIGKQLIHSATSTAANYRAACRGRSKDDFFAKLNIVVEEVDETLFWLEILEETEIVDPNKLIELKREATELISVFAKARSNTH